MPLRRPWLSSPAAVTALALALLLAWDASDADLALARWSGGAAGFPWREHVLLTTVLHDGARAVAAALVLWLLSGLARPTGPLRSLPPARIAWLAAIVVSGMLLVSLLKRGSSTSCPWDLQAFGGTAAHVSHWRWGLADGGPGHCFPAGHASAGFAFVAGWFAFRDVRPRLATAWLLLALAAGALLGGAQQLRGAHFASHTLWTAWTCWTWSWCCSRCLPASHAPAAG